MDIVKQLREQAQEIALEGHNGWGNTMLIAADEIERLQAAQQSFAPDASLVFRDSSGVVTCKVCGTGLGFE